jgi:hypothetical protein
MINYIFRKGTIKWVGSDNEYFGNKKKVDAIKIVDTNGKIGRKVCKVVSTIWNKKDFVNVFFKI